MRIMRRFGLVLLLCLAVFMPMVSGVGAPKPTLSITPTPTSASTVNGGSVTYSLALTSSNISGTVTMSASGLPLLATASFSPASFAISPSNPNRTVVMTVNTSALNGFGDSNIAVRASTSSVQVTTNVSLTICRFTVSATPSTVKISKGQTATYAVTIARCPGYTGAPSLTVSGLPLFSGATFTPNPVAGTTSTLVVTTNALTASGNFTLVIGGTGAVTASVGLNIDASNGGGGHSPFTISGNLTGALSPGVTRPLDLTLTNPNNQDLNVDSVSVSLTSINKSGCSLSTNYSVTQFAGTYPIVVPHNGSRSLSAAGIPSSQWPQVRMVNLSTNQDACKGAAITMTYTGTGSGT